MTRTKRFVLRMVLSGVVAGVPSASSADEPGPCPAPRSACSTLEAVRLQLRKAPSQRLNGRGRGGSIDFGKPLESTTYRICIFQGEEHDHVFAGELPPGSLWKQSKNGFVYRDRYGALHDGIKTFTIRNSARGVTTVAVKGTGVALDLGAFPLDLPVTLQIWTVHNQNGLDDECLEHALETASFDDPSGFSATVH